MRRAAISVCWIVGFLLRCDAFEVSQARAYRPARSRATSRPVLMRNPIDDVVNYLTNMGGYTGFTEGQLKGETALTDADVEDFGKQTATNDTVTTVFVLLLLATPLIVGYIGFSIGVFAVPSFIPK
jgi:hypothetical protein